MKELLGVLIFLEENIMNWIYLITAGLFETVWATTMKLSHGFTKLNYTIMTIVGLALSMGLLALAIKKMPMSLAYPIWTGIGAVGSIIAGVILFGDKLSPLTWAFVALLLISIIGIKITSGN
ncbi:membrane transporter [Companilactobacillus mindensis DSM 14500]|jgi:Membrane transporters of cations and cationic drugs|uniref:Membrane transporter n=2 Tax=Companilactobacillus mindensis TaxID=167481 RepID=A0A0R1QDB4_9LACO|nr:membrane transporter [Companilactobacillus mindensis DSM 14500]